MIRRASALAPLAGVLVLALAGAAFVLSAYILRNPEVTLGWDTPTYVWQAKEVGALGLVDPVVASRPGFPLLAGVLTALTPLPEYQLIPILAGVLPAVTGLAAAALARRSLRLDHAATAAVALAVASSFFLVRMAGGLYANLLTVALVAAALLPLSSMLEGRRHGAAALILLLAAGAAHWIFLGVFVAIAGGVLLWHLVEAARRGRDRAPIVRGLGVLALAGAVTLLVSFLVLGGRPNLAGATRVTSNFLLKFQGLVRGMGLEVVLPLVGLGAALLYLRRRDPRADFLRRLALVWVAVTALALVGWTVRETVPLHRFLLFTLPVPILVGLGAGTVGRVLGAWRGLRPTSARALTALGAGAMVVAAAMPSLFFLTTNLLPYMTPREVDNAVTLDAYVATVPAPRSTIVVLDRPDETHAALRHDEHVVRAALAPTRQDDVAFYWGTVENLRAGRPTPGFADGDAEDRWRTAVRLTERPHESVLLQPQGPAAFARALGAGAEEVAPGVAAFDPAGERVPAARFDEAPLNTPLGVGAAAGAVVVLLLAVGIAWSAALLPGEDPFTVAALAPAFGAAVLVIASGAEVLGLPPYGGGAVVALLLAGGGGLALLMGRRRAGSAPG